MKKLFSFILILLSMSFIFGHEICSNLDESELPICFSDDERELVVHNAYVLSYREVYEQAEYVMYVMHKNDSDNTVKRSNNFREDLSVSTKSAIPDDYKNTGYDKGHLAPAADFNYSEDAMSETFFMSNMSPQVPKLNRVLWRKLEELFRNISSNYDKTYIITGPVLDSDKMIKEYKTIGNNKVAVPYFYYKCGLFIKDNEYYTISFLIPNSDEIENYDIYQYSINEIETLCNMDFFSFLDDNIESDLESSIMKIEY